MRQVHLARKLGVSRGAVCNWESGEREMSLTTAQRIAAILGCTLDELVSAEESKEVA